MTHRPPIFWIVALGIVMVISLVWRPLLWVLPIFAVCSWVCRNKLNRKNKI